MLPRQLLHVFLDATLGWSGKAVSLLRTLVTRTIYTQPAAMNRQPESLAFFKK
jgi:hypothetical protein